MQEWLTELAMSRDTPLIAAFALGLLTAISPCPLATNITATAYIARQVTHRAAVLRNGLLYTLGRMFTYTLIGLIIFWGGSKFHISSNLQSHGEQILGPLLIVMGIVMLGILRFPSIGNAGMGERISKRFANKQGLAAFLMGVVFALAFCPYSGALFFVMLIPLMLMVGSVGLVLPAIYSVGTALPVVLFAILIAYSMAQVGSYFQRLKKIERVLRMVTGVVFLATGIYLVVNTYL